MADILSANSSYSTGTNDTASTAVDGVTLHAAANINGALSACVQIETILGVGTTLIGNQADLVARLAVGITNAGVLRVNDATAFPGPLDVARGGTGAATFTDGGILLGSGTGAITALGVASNGQIPIGDNTTDPVLATITGGAGIDVTNGAGTISLAVDNTVFNVAPASVGSGSTRTHEGATTISSSQNLSGVHYYSTFTLDVSQTLTIPDGEDGLWIEATTSITINGVIDAEGSGAAGGAGGSSGAVGTAGTNRYGQAGGGGGSGASDATSGQGEAGGAGGDALAHGFTLASGGAAGAQPSSGNNDGNDATAGTSESGALGLLRRTPTYGAILGAPGGGGGGGGGNISGGAGGRGAGFIVLIAPTITFGASSTLNAGGENGTAGSNSASPSGGGGGGGGGIILIRCRSFTDSGATYDTGGGAAGAAGTDTSGPNDAGAGGAGAAGFRQVNIY